MAQEGVKRKLTAILSADVVGYSRLMEEDEASTVKTITAYRESVTSLIEHHRGRVVDSPGDNLLAEFVSVVDAVQCAVETQELLKAKNAELPENRGMLFRMGINLGDVIEEGNRIYGDGVNIASRIEAMADPGGICISMSVYNQIKKKLALDYEDLGEHTVKNISEPIRVYRVPLEPTAGVVKVGTVKKAKFKRWQWVTLAVAMVIAIVAGAWVIKYNILRPAPVEKASIENMAYPLPDKPSFAILPFENMNDDPELEYVSVGFTDTLISGLSKLPEILVIARTSTFAYKGKPIAIKQIAEELGVHYVIEGSVQKSGDQLRITVQMIDSLTGYHVWSERYVVNIEDIFKIQDEIALKIIKSVGGKYDLVIETRPSLAAGTNNFDAYLKNLKAAHLFWWGKVSADNYKNVKQLCEETIALDPNYVYPYVLLTHVYQREARYGFSKSPEKSREIGLKMAKKAVEIDESSSDAHSALAAIYYNTKQHDKAIEEYKRAIALNPNNPDGYWIGWVLIYVGRPQEAIPYFRTMMRVSPRYYGGLFFLGAAYLFMEKYEDAIPYYQKAIKYLPGYWRSYADLAACYAALGREEEAKAMAEKLLKAHPVFTVERYIKGLPAKYPEVLKPLEEALRKVEFPE